MGAKKFKSALSMFVAFALSFNSILPATFADKDTIADKRKQVIEIADKILAKDDLATRFRGTTYSNEGNFKNFQKLLGMILGKVRKNGSLKRKVFLKMPAITQSQR